MEGSLGEFDVCQVASPQPSSLDWAPPFPGGCWDSRQVTLFEALQSFLHPGCAEAAGEGGRAPLQGLGEG